MRCKLWLLFGLVAGLALASPAGWARDARKQQARQLFLQAEQHYRRGEFAEALAGYAEAYQVMALPAFVFNMAQCHRKLDQYERALFFYQGYLRDAPGAANRDLVLELMAECRRKLDLQRAAASDLRARTGPARPDPGDSVADRAAQAVREPPAPPVPDSPPVYKSWWFWTAVGGAVAAGVVAGAVIGTRPDGPRLSEGSLGRLDLRGH